MWYVATLGLNRVWTKTSSVRAGRNTLTHNQSTHNGPADSDVISTSFSQATYRRQGIRLLGSYLKNAINRSDYLPRESRIKLFPRQIILKTSWLPNCTVIVPLPYCRRVVTEINLHFSASPAVASMRFGKRKGVCVKAFIRRQVG